MNPWINALIQIAVFIGAIYVVGFLISLINRLFYFLTGDSKVILYGTGFFGTPIHELSHALFCLIFMHKIEEISLFQIDEESGTLGYVTHSWNKKNIYALIGNFFIGVAPILVGTSLLILLMFLIIPNTFFGINDALAVVAKDLDYSQIPATIWNCVLIFFKGAGDWRWWLYLIPVILIALHMNLSKADLKGTLIAIPFLAAIIILLNVIFGFWITSAYPGFLNIMAYGEVYLGVILLMSLAFAILSLSLALLIFAFRKIFHLD